MEAELEQLVKSLGLEKYRRHIFLCADQTEAKCAPKKAGLESWEFLKRRLKELNPSIRCVSLQPDASFHGLEGWKHMPTAMRPAIYDDKIADENLTVSTEDSYRMVKRMACEEGLLVSPSAAAALLGSFEVAKRIPEKEHAVIITIFADSASKYLNERFWDET